MCWFMGVCASNADEMKNGGRLKYMCQQNANPDNKEGLHVLHVFQPSCAACVFKSTTPVADAGFKEGGGGVVVEGGHQKGEGAVCINWMCGISSWCVKNHPKMAYGD